MSTLKEQILNHINERYDVVPDHPFSKFPDYAVFRHKSNNKWFALVMNVPFEKLDVQKSGNVDVIDLKVDPEIKSVLLQKPGFFPAYHMNKEHWISLALDQTIPQQNLIDLIEDSFNLTS